MQILAPGYYKKFKCIADRCTHSCCVGWEIDVDPDTLAKYKSLQGKMGECIRASIAEDGDGAHFVLGVNDRCPHLDGRGLCNIIKTLGEGYLCEICREHPRFYNRVAGQLECGLGASCEAAAALILSEDGYDRLVPITNVENLQNARTCAEFCAKTQRDALFLLLVDRTRPYAERRREIATRFAGNIPLNGAEKRQLLASLEYLDPAHAALLQEVAGHCEPYAENAVYCERFLAYLIYRHAGPARSAREFAVSVALALFVEELFCTLIQAKGIPPVQAVVLLSEELEYSEENTDALRFALECKML
ncbi:MAG: flagellin lysine-N-methylase [Clostridia bacterium]|nr:flagellin lysine-N-methylase [Clostridia bacterium]